MRIGFLKIGEIGYKRGMKVLIHSDDSIQVDQRLQEFVEGVVQSTLEPFAGHITRAEVHLSDENKRKGGSVDKRCTIEVRIQKRQPDAVTHHADTTEQAVSGAADKLLRVVEKIFSQLRDHRP